MRENFIPVEVFRDNKYELWYMNVSNLSLGELTKLKKELMGNVAIRGITKIINDNISSEYNNYCSIRQYRRELKKEQKRQSSKVKKKLCNYRKGRR